MHYVIEQKKEKIAASGPPYFFLLANYIMHLLGHFQESMPFSASVRGAASVVLSQDTHFI